MGKIKYYSKEKQPKTKKVWVCTNCGSSNVQYKSWVNANTGKCNDSVMISSEEEDCWCEDCETHPKIQLVELKPDAHVIGFQVVGVGDNEGEIHPDMDASFCVYCLSQANIMLATASDLDTGEFRLLAIWKDDIEEPTMMFLGNNPRD